MVRGSGPVGGLARGVEHDLDAVELMEGFTNRTMTPGDPIRKDVSDVLLVARGPVLRHY